MPLVIRALGLEADDSDAEAEEALARVRAAEAALERLDELVAEGWVLEDTAERLRGHVPVPDRPLLGAHRSRRRRQDREAVAEVPAAPRELIEAERHAVVELRNTGEISDEVMRRVERDLDLEDSRLDA